jgi:hypothetical protein
MALIGRISYRVLVGKPEWKKNYFEDLDVDGRIILNWISKNGGCGLDSSG